MTKFKKILLFFVILIIVGALGLGGYFLYRNKNIISDIKSNLPGTLFGPKSAKKAETLSADKIIYWTNYYRTQDGLKKLTKNEILENAAQKKVDDMFQKQYFEHVSPSGVTPAELVKSVGYSYKVTGENLALGDFKDEKDLVDAWMNSPGHRANILNIEYTQIGVASSLGNYQDWGTTWMSVQEFGKPMPVCDKPSESLSSEINNKKAEYENLIEQINSLSSQANDDIKKGNEIAKASGNAAAQPYWDKGNAERAQAEELQIQAGNLANEIKRITATYNTQVNEYNTCIKQ